MKVFGFPVDRKRIYLLFLLIIPRNSMRKVSETTTDSV